MPWSVLDCPAYAGLSHPAKALLFEVARQFVKDNNGRMLLSLAYLKTRGWLSAGVIQKAKQELLDASFIFETVKGQRPNRASWYAITWQALDRLQGYDVGALETFKRGAYRDAPGKEKRQAPMCKNPKKKIVIPCAGIEKALIVPAHGIETHSVVPPHGAIEVILGARSIPPHGNHLETPSDAVCIGEVLATLSTGTTPGLFSGTKTGNSSTQRHSTSGSSSIRSDASTALEVAPTECELAATSEAVDDVEMF